MFKTLFHGSVFFCMMSLIASPVLADDAFESLQPDQVLSQFKVENVYVNELGNAMGGRFRHIPSGFVLDVLRIQSVPQAFIWVNSPPPSDKGEPHTCEHLLLGKGTRGRYVASLEDMSLGNSSAFTMQLQTCYHFNTSAGADVFYNLLDAKLNALLHPNFSDEEIRREVCNIGYTIDPVDSTLRLEEKGTVYNEMVSGYERPWSNLGYELGRLMYGPNHPLSNESGGLPAAIRTMVPADLWSFQRREYRLSNMGMVASIPDEFKLSDFLSQVSAIFAKVEPDARPGDDPATLNDRLPPPSPAPVGETRVVSFPNRNEAEPGLLVVGWPPTLDYDNNEGYMLDLLISNLADGPTSNLYRKFIDSQTRVIDVGANSVFGWTSADLGHPVYIGLSSVKSDVLTVPMIDSIRGLVLDEIADIAAYPDGSPALAAFNKRARGRVIERRRDLRKFLNSPPRFGFRGASAQWMQHLNHMQKTPGFRKSLTLDSELAFADSLLDGKTNFWRDYIAKWGLLKRVPYAVGARANPDMLRQSETDRASRVDAFIAGLQKRYGGVDRNEALRRYKEEYDAQTAIIDERAKSIPMPPFVSHPPLTLDDQLRFTDDTLPGGAPLVASTFDNMTGATVGLAFDMYVVPPSELVYVAALPTLLTEVGVIRDGEPIPYDKMKESIRREILGLRAYYSVNYRTERVELVLKASGSDGPESQKAMDWLATVLFDPDWRPENLPRIRDAVDLTLKNLRNTMRGAEEAWVNDPANAYWRQTNALLLSADCFLTRTYALHRLRWILKDPGDPMAGHAFADFADRLATVGSRMPRAQAESTLARLTGDESSSPSDPFADTILAEFRSLPSAAQKLAREAIGDLQQMESDVPDGSFGTDWSRLCREMIADLNTPSGVGLRQLQDVMARVRHGDNVRTFMIGNTADQAALAPRLEQLLARLDPRQSTKETYHGAPIVVGRLQERMPTARQPLYVGLINENTRSGVHINTAPCASFVDHDRESLLRFLSARLYGGGGAHSMFMKTWGAGLAYSNGLRSNESTGRLIYYAERCPDLAQTMQFVVNELKNAPYDTSLAQYAIAQAFASYRGASRYERRGEAMANDLADGVTPDAVRGFREGVVALRDSRNLYAELSNRMEYTYGQVLPGYGPRGSESPGAQYFVIGPEKQFASYEEYLRSTEGDDVTLYRLFPRDYWIVGEEGR